MTVERYEPANLEALDLTKQSLDQLAETIHREDTKAHKAAVTTLVHAIRAGEALLEARKRIEPGGWGRWVEANIPIDRGTCNSYMRCATYQDKLGDPAELTIMAAKRLLQGEAWVNYSIPKTPSEQAKEARRLSTGGLSLREISEELGVCKSMVWAWLNPERVRATKSRSRYRKRAERAALLEQEKRTARDAAAKATGGELEKAYNLIRQAAAAIDRAPSPPCSSSRGGGCPSSKGGRVPVEQGGEGARTQAGHTP